MNELVFKGQNDQVVTTSLKVAEVFGKEHQHILRDIRDLVEGVSRIGDTPMFEETTYIHPQNKQQYPMFLMNRDGFTLLAMGFTGDKALRFKMAYINAFNEMERTLREMQPKLPTTYLEALKALVKSEEEKQQALLEAKKAQDHVNMLVHNGKTYTSSEIAKELGMKSAIALNKLLEEKHVQYKQNGTWLLYSEHCEKGLTSVKQIQLDNGTIQYDRRWTGKGRDFILNLIR